MEKNQNSKKAKPAFIIVWAKNSDFKDCIEIPLEKANDNDAKAEIEKLYPKLEFYGYTVQPV